MDESDHQQRLVLTVYRRLWDYNGGQKRRPPCHSWEQLPAVMRHVREKDIPQVRILEESGQHTHTHTVSIIAEGMHSLYLSDQTAPPSSHLEPHTLHGNGNRSTAVS